MGFLCKSGSQTSTQTTDIPDYIKQPLLDNLKKAGDLVKQPYQEYGGARIEDFNQDQLNAMQQIRDMQGTGQADLDAAMAGIMGLSPVTNQNVTSRTFDSAAADQYMNPYIDNVLDKARDRMFRADDIARQGRDARSIQAGAFGGDRQGIMEAEAQKNLGDRVATMEADQLAKAYGAAQKAYATDAGMDLKAQQLNQAADLSAQGLAGKQALASAQGIAGLVGAGQGLGFDQTNALMQVGAGQQQMGQAQKDLAFSDFKSQAAGSTP